MFTKSSRKSLCFFLTFLMVVGISLFFASTFVRATLCSPKYMERFLTSSEITQYCDDVFEQRIALLSENSQIPVRVFAASDNIGGYSETIVDKFYNGSDTSMLTKDKINVYESLIIEFLDGNGETYDDELVHNTAVKAAEIYADCYGVQNIEPLRQFVNDTISYYGKLSSAGLVIVLISFLLMLALFNNKKKAFMYFSSALSATGLSFIFVGLICLIFGVGKGGVITPAVYSDAIFKSINVMLIALVLIGAVLTVLSTMAALRLNKQLRKSSKL